MANKHDRDSNLSYNITIINKRQLLKLFRYQPFLHFIGRNSKIHYFIEIYIEL